MLTGDEDPGEFAFLGQAARAPGAAGSQAIPASGTIAGSRVPLICRGAPGYVAAANLHV
ncbi:hypothetical protein [Methanoculleus sediminis]|uniref:hypothetical protein n=1 Tax=Methanoculleus sediminis TaxID=1550566 RepID=UPI000A681F75|nr:hypothetical protein [Methanoculleus sediminis]